MFAGARIESIDPETGQANIIGSFGEISSSSGDITHPRMILRNTRGVEDSRRARLVEQLRLGGIVKDMEDEVSHAEMQAEYLKDDIGDQPDFKDTSLDSAKKKLALAKRADTEYKKRTEQLYPNRRGVQAIAHQVARTFVRSYASVTTFKESEEYKHYTNTLSRIIRDADRNIYGLGGPHTSAMGITSYQSDIERKSVKNADGYTISKYKIYDLENRENIWISIDEARGRLASEKSETGILDANLSDPFLEVLYILTASGMFNEMGIEGALTPAAFGRVEIPVDGEEGIIIFSNKVSFAVGVPNRETGRRSFVMRLGQRDGTTVEWTIPEGFIQIPVRGKEDSIKMSQTHHTGLWGGDYPYTYEYNQGMLEEESRNNGTAYPAEGVKKS